MKTKKLFAAAALSLLCLTGCGNLPFPVGMTDADTAPVAVQPAADIQPEPDILPDGQHVPDKEAAPDKETVPENVTVPDKEAAPEKVTVPEREAVPDKEAAPEKVTVPEKEATPAKEIIPDKEQAQPADVFAGAEVISYSVAAECIMNGAIFGIGDDLVAIGDKIGQRTRYPDGVNSYIKGKGRAIHYFYPGLIISTTEDGIIYRIALTNEADAGGTAHLACGLKLGDSLKLAEQIVGMLNDHGEGTYSCSLGSSDFYVQADADGKMTKIAVENMDVFQ